VILGVTLPRTEPPALYSYPARPLNGGPLPKALPKRGAWAAEPKWNGWRALVHVPSGAMFNRQGKRLSIASEFESSLEILRATLDAEAFKWVDCEALDRRHALARGTLIVLDVLPIPGAGYRDKTPEDYRERRAWLTPLPMPRSLVDVRSHSVYLTPSSIEPLWYGGDPQGMWDECAKANRQLGAVFYEGIVMKRCDALYPTQLRNPEETTPAWVKHRWHF
jgi:hypothetical protein